MVNLLVRIVGWSFCLTFFALLCLQRLGFLSPATVIAANEDQNLVLYDWQQGLALPIVDLEGDISKLDWSPDGQYLSFISSVGNEQALYLASRNGRELTRLPALHLETYHHAAWSADSRYFAYVGEDYQIYLWDRQTANSRALTQAPDIDFSAPQWSPDGHALAMVGFQQTETAVDLYQLNFADLEHALFLEEVTNIDLYQVAFPDLALTNLTVDFADTPLWFYWHETALDFIAYTRLPNALFSEEWTLYRYHESEFEVLIPANYHYIISNMPIPTWSGMDELLLFTQEGERIFAQSPDRHWVLYEVADRFKLYLHRIIAHEGDYYVIGTSNGKRLFFRFDVARAELDLLPLNLRNFTDLALRNSTFLDSR